MAYRLDARGADIKTLTTPRAKVGPCCGCMCVDTSFTVRLSRPAAMACSHRLAEITSCSMQSFTA